LSQLAGESLLRGILGKRRNRSLSNNIQHFKRLGILRSTAILFLFLTVLLSPRFLVPLGRARIKVSYRGYQDYWTFPRPEGELGVSSRSIEHWPREAKFAITRDLPEGSVLAIWPGSRLEFKQPKRCFKVRPGFQAVVAGSGAMEMEVPLTGAERGQWRVLVPVSDLRFLGHVEKWIGRGAIFEWIRQHQKSSPRWIASGWVNELPQRSPVPPLKAVPGASFGQSLHFPAEPMNGMR
jgi:hypothetical protein